MYFRSAFVAAAMSAVMSLPALAATPVAPNSGWVTFSFGGVGSSFSGEPFTFTLTHGGKLTVTDAFNDGDRFEIFDFGSSLGLTSVPTATGVDIGNDYDLGAVDPRYSTGMWMLGAGSYSITGIMIDSPYGGGGGALRVDQVPLPAAGLMLLTGLAGIAGLRRRKTT